MTCLGALKHGKHIVHMLKAGIHSEASLTFFFFFFLITVYSNLGMDKLSICQRDKTRLTIIIIRYVSVSAFVATLGVVVKHEIGCLIKIFN